MSEKKPDENIKSLLMYTFNPESNNNNEIKNIINEVIKKVENPDNKLIDQMKEDKEFFSKKKFIQSKKAMERLSQLINAIKYKIPIMEEGPTGTSKTFTTLIAIDYLNYRKQKENPNDTNRIKELLRYNLSSQTKSDDLLSQVVGDQNSPAGLKNIDGVFLKAFRDGYPLLLDEFNLASESVLQFLLESITSGILSIIINGKGLQKINMHEDFCLITTQNPPTGMFAGKRNAFSKEFLSKFSKVKFEIDLEELKEITRGSAKEFNYNNEKVIDEMVKFHEKWVKNYVSDDDVQCFTIRDILATIKLISEGKGNYESINAIYGARYPKEMKLKLQEVLKEFPNLSQSLNSSKPHLDENFPYCYINESLVNTVNQCMFSLENGRNIIISGNRGNGKSFLAKNLSKFYNTKSFGQNLYNQDNYCICTNKIECSDLIGNQKPSDKIQEGQEMLVWKDGFLTEAIRNGSSIVLDNINEASSTVTERLNGLLDKTYEIKELYFELPENPNEGRIKINENFRIICVCEYEKLKKMSPAFINRFDVIFLEEQIEKNISDEKLKQLISVILISEKSKNNKKVEKEEEEDEDIDNNEEFGEKLSFSDEDSNSCNNSERNSNENEKTDSKKDESNQDDSQSKKNFNKALSSISNDTESRNNIGKSSIQLIDIDYDQKEQKQINEIFNKIEREFIQNQDNQKYFEEIIKNIKKIEDFTIYNVTKFIISLDILNEVINIKNDAKIEYNIIINFTYDLIFSKINQIEKININEQIMDFFDSKLDEENGNDEIDDKYHFKDSESLRKFMVFLMASSLIKLHLCVIGPPGGGKTTSARAFSRIRGKLLELDEEPFRMFTFNEDTKPHDFFGSSTLSKGNIKFTLGPLGRAIENGSVFIADEFNLTSIQTMKSIYPVLEPNYNMRIRIPGIENPIIMNDNFFFIICQNDSNTLGRNLIPIDLDYKLRTIYYPPAELEDIKEICKNINNDISEAQNLEDKLSDDDAKKCGEYMMELNKLNQRILSPWSLRDIHKLFSRNTNIRKKNHKFINIGLVENILFYTMSSVTKDNEERIINDIIDLIYKIFNNSDNNELKKEELKKLFEANTILKNDYHKMEKEEIIEFYLEKGYCKIYYQQYKIKLTDNEDNEEKQKIIREKIKKLEEKNKLPKFLNSLFKILLSTENEPLLLSGNTSYKKELAKEFLKDASVISLNQEITINQLLGSSSFLNKEDGKYFYFKELCNLLKISNLSNLLKYLNIWIEKEKKSNGEIPEKISLKIEIDKIKEKVVGEKFPFKIPVENLYNKLFNEKDIENELKENDNNLLNDMVIEFRPGLILSAIFGERSLILGDLPNAKTVVLERFNELISGKHNLTLNEDIHQTFTNEKNKEFSGFNNFRILATCRKGYENRLSEALLSRFTIISIDKYSKEEQKEILFIKSKGKKKLKENDIEKLINYSKEFEDIFNIEFPLTKMVKCLDLYEKFYKENTEVELFFPFYILANGLLEKRNEDNIYKLKSIDKNVKVPEISPLKINSNNENILESKYTNLGIYSSHIKLPDNYDEIFFSQKMNELINVLHTGLCTKTPVILEGYPEQGKTTAIKYLADYLNFEIININISKETKVEDLLCQISIEKDKDNNIKIKNNETKLLKSLKSHEKNKKSIVVFQNIDKASPAVLETLTSICGPINTNILLPNGDTFQKGEIHIFLIFNKQNGETREKLPSTLIHNSLYYKVENPDDNDINGIIQRLFSHNKIKDSEIKNFQRIYFESKKFISQQTNENPLTISDIKKYMLFRINCPSVESFIITQFIFNYRFSNLKLIEESQKNLGLINLLFDPSLNYLNDSNNLVIKLIQGKKDSEINVKTYNNETIKKEVDKIINEFNNITINGKYSLIFLICSIMSKRACIIQGDNCSGKTFLIRFLAKMFGRNLIEFQMNSSMGMSIFTRDSLINESLNIQDKKHLEELINEIKHLLEFSQNDEIKDFRNLTVPQYKKIVKKINSKIKFLKDLKKNSESISNLIKIKKKILLIISPVNQIKYKDSDFLRALREGEWVLIDGIESAPNQIIEKIISLCGDNPELNIFESGKGIYFSNQNKGDNIEKIHENFHLFITYNSSKNNSKKIEQTLFNKCMTFTSPQIDSKVEDAALALFSKINNYKNQNILANLSTRISNFHCYCVKESQKNPYNFAGRIPITPSYLLFTANIFNNSFNEPYENKVYNSLLNYWKSISNESIKENFKKNSLIAFKEEPFELKFKQNINKKLNNILLLIKNCQEIIINNKSSDFFLIDFIKECLNLELEESELQKICNYINETLEVLNKTLKSLNENLKKKNNSSHIFGYIMQMKIIYKIFKDIQSKFSEIESKYYSIKLNSEIIENIEAIKESIMKLKLLGQLIIDKNTFNQKIKLFVFDFDLNKLLKLVNDFIQSNDTYSFKYLIDYLHDKKNLLNVIDSIFPYNSNKLNDFSKKIINIIYLLNKKKINFTFRIEGSNPYKFIYDREQNDRLNPYLIIKNTEFYFAEGSKIFCPKIEFQLKIDEKKIKPCLETSMIFLQIIEYFANIKNITKKEIHKNYKLIEENKNNIKIPNDYFLLENLFNDNEKTSKISKIWAIIFNCNENKEFMDYLSNYLHPIESDLIKQFRLFFNEIKNHNISNIVNITKQLISFCDENSILWMDSIGKFTKNKSEIDNYILRVTLEIDNLEKLSISLNINLYQYIERLKEIKAELNKNNVDNEMKEKLKIKIDKLKNDLNTYLNNRKFQKCHRVIQKLKTKIINSYDENEEYISNLEVEVKDLITYINTNYANSKQENYLWPIPKNEKYSNHPEVILFKNLIWYSKIQEALLEIKRENKIGVKKGIISKIEKISEIKPIIDYMEFKLENSGNLGLDDFNFIESHLRNVFLLNLIEENEERISEDYLNFEKHINNLKSRINTNENLYNYIYSIANEYSTLSSNFKIYLPEFRTLDLIYLFMSKTSRGIKNDLLLKEYSEISIEKLEKLIDEKENDYIKLMTKIIILLIQEKLLKNDIELNLDYDKVYNEYIEKNLDNKFYKQLEFSMYIAKLLNDKKNNSKIKLEYDDFIEFSEENLNKGINYFIKSENIAKKYPSLLFYFCKNHYFSSLLLSKVKNNKYFLNFENESFQNEIPFWILCLRVLSSLHCIEYGNDIFKKEELNYEIKKKLSQNIKNKKINNSNWLNLVLENIPREILQINYRMYYEFFNNLSSNIILDDDYIKNLIEEIIRKRHLEIIDIVIKSDETNLPTNLDFSIENNLKKIILDPTNFILGQIENVKNKKLKELSKIDEVNHLRKSLEEYINNCDFRIHKLKAAILKENSNAEFEYANKIEREKELLVEKELNDKKNIRKLYIKKYENLKCFIEEEEKKIKEKNNNSDNLDFIIKLNKNDIEELKEKRKIIMENKDFFKLNQEKFISIARFKYKYNKSYEKGKLSFIFETFTEENLELSGTLFFNSLKKENIKKIIFHGDNGQEQCLDIDKDFENINDKEIIKTIKFYELLPLEDDEQLRKTIQTKTDGLNTNLPKVYFNNLTQENFIDKIFELSKILNQFLEILGKIKNEFIHEKYINCLNEINSLIKEINNNNEATIGTNSCQIVNEELEELDKNIESIDKNIKEFDENYQLKYMLELLSLYKILNNQKIFNKSFNLEIPKEHNEITNFEFNIEGLKAVDLSIPFISYDNKNNKIEFCYPNLEKTIGPICPNLSGDYIEIKILNSIKNKILLTDIEEIKTNSEEDISKILENIKEYDGKINVFVNNKIEEGEDLLIKLKIPELLKDEEEIHFYQFNLILKTDEISNSQNILKIHCKFYIKLIPLTLLLISENYNLKLIENKKFKLNTNFVYSKEKLIFRLKNYFDFNIDFQAKIESLEENEMKEPSFNCNLNEGKIELIIPEIEEKLNNNSDFDKLSGVITIGLTEQYKIEIEINAFIIPYEIDMYIYDYTEKNFINCPIFYFTYDDVKDEDFAINLYLKIESSFWLKPNKMILDWTIDNKNIEIFSKEKEINLDENQIIQLELKLKKDIIINEEETLEIKLIELDPNLKNENSIKVYIKVAPEIRASNIKELSKKFEFFVYDEKKGFFRDNKAEYSIKNNELSKTILYPFKFYNHLKYYLEFKKDNEINYYYLYHPLMQIKNCIFYHINSEDLRAKIGNTNYDPLKFFNTYLNEKIFYLFCTIIELSDGKKIMVDFIQDLEENIFNEWIEIKEDNKKIEKLEQFCKQKKYKFRNMSKSYMLSFSYLAYLIIENKNDLLQKLESLLHDLEGEDINNFIKLKENFHKNNREDQLIKYDIIIFFYNFFKSNEYSFFPERTKDFRELKDEEVLANKIRDLRKKYYSYKGEQNKNNNFISNKIKLIIDKLKNQNKFKSEISENIYIIYDKDEPVIQKNENLIKNDIHQNVEINELKKINSQSEPPPFKTNIGLNNKFSNIKEIINFYNNCISDTNILPLHLIKLLYNSNLSIDEKKQLNQELEKRFTKLLLTFKDLKYEEEDYCIISKTIKDFKESMNDMLLKFEKGKTNFKDLIPNIKLNKKALNKIYTISEKSEFKLEAKNWKIKIIEKNILFTKKNILGFQSKINKSNNDNNNNNILEENRIENNQNVQQKEKKKRRKY